MLKKIVLVLLLILLAILAFAATKPDNFSVQRTATINAPPEKIYPLLADFNNWSVWSPWDKLDPNMKRTLAGAQTTPGASYAWEGNKDVGRGRMEILESQPSARLLIKLDFLEPFESHSLTEFTLEPAGDATKVVWSMSGPAPFISKLMQVFMDMDQMIGKDFESGLANLKTAAEK